MYFKVFISKSWSKRSASCRSRFIQRFLNTGYEIRDARRLGGIWYLISFSVFFAS